VGRSALLSEYVALLNSTPPAPLYKLTAGGGGRGAYSSNSYMGTGASSVSNSIGLAMLMMAVQSPVLHDHLFPHCVNLQRHQRPVALIGLYGVGG
jgi:hypothetical protein